MITGSAHPAKNALPGFYLEVLEVKCYTKNGQQGGVFEQPLQSFNVNFYDNFPVPREDWCKQVKSPEFRGLD